MNQRRQTGAAASHSQFDHEWMNRAKDFAGRRVVLKGLPKGIPDALVRDIVKTKMYGRIQNGVVDTRDTGILADADGVKRMPM